MACEKVKPTLPLLDGLCALAQTISYEVRLYFILLSSVVLVCTYNLAYFNFFQVYLWLIIVLNVKCVIFLHDCCSDTIFTALINVL